MRLNPEAMKSCPICGWRDITTSTKYEGRFIPCCDTCSVGVVPFDAEVSMASRAVQFALENPGMTARDIRIGIGISEPHRNSVSSALSRAVEDGELVRVGGGRGRVDGAYYPARQGRKAA